MDARGAHGARGVTSTALTWSRAPHADAHVDIVSRGGGSRWRIAKGYDERARLESGLPYALWRDGRDTGETFATVAQAKARAAELSAGGVP